MTGAQSRVDLHANLNDASFTHAVILTYTFDTSFFEKYCLERLRAFSACASITVCLDRATYESALNAPISARPRKVNLRYLLHPVDVPGVFHPKIVLLTSATRGRLIIGSANFTRPGLTSNAELAAVYDFKKANQEEFRSLFHSTFQFLWNINTEWPSRNLRSNLQEIARECEWIANPVNDDAAPARLFTNIDEALLEQLAALAGPDIQSAAVVAPYFDESPALMKQILLRTGAQKLKLYTQNGRTTLSADWLRHELVKDGTVEVYLCDYSETERNQPLHGKLLALTSPTQTVVTYGSANCTTPALLKTAKQGNVECMVACILSPQQARKALPRLLDPENQAQRIVDPSGLVTADHDDIETYVPSFPIQIEEAEIGQGQILIWLSRSSADLAQQAKLEFSGGNCLRFPVNASQSLLTVKLTEALEKRAARESVILSLEDSREQQASNRVFVINLQEDTAGLSIRKARHVKDAEQDAVGLLAVLHDLRSGVDEEALRTFLTYCNIPLVLGPRPGWRSHARNGPSDDGMRGFGRRNFEMALSLHALVLDFCDRHIKKLNLHTSERRVEGVSNFVHISLAIAGILDAQIERALSGLEVRTKVSSGEWSQFRELCDAYLLRYQTLNKLLWHEYLNKLRVRYPRRIAQLQAAFAPELPPLQALSTSILNYRERVEQLRVAKCLLPARQCVTARPFGYFNSIFGNENWQRFAGGMQTIDASLTDFATQTQF